MSIVPVESSFEQPSDSRSNMFLRHDRRGGEAVSRLTYAARIKEHFRYDTIKF